jgi:HD superfamily phosphodiesterase
MGLAEWAYSLSESLLSDPPPRRWAHSLGVAKRARSLGSILGGDAELLEAAAVLHDIGYAPAHRHDRLSSAGRRALPP